MFQVYRKPSFVERLIALFYWVDAADKTRKAQEEASMRRVQWNMRQYELDTASDTGRGDEA